MIKATMVKKGAMEIDMGTNRIDALKRKHGYKPVGNIEFKATFEKVEIMKPTPAG